MTSNNYLIKFLFLTALINVCFGQCPAVEECLSTNKTCAFLPAPFSSEPSASSRGWDLFKLRESVWMFYDKSTGALITFTNGILTVIDAPLSADSNLEDGRLKQNMAINSIIRGKTVNRVRLIYGHRHYDHIGNMNRVYGSLRTQFPKIPIQVYANRDTIMYIKRYPEAKLPEVTNIVPRKGMTIRSSPDLIHRLYLRRGHTLSDMLIHIPKNKKGDVGVIHIADYITTKFTPWYGFGVAQDLYGYINTLRFMMKLDYEKFSPGHGFVGDKSDVEINLNYTLDALQFSVQSASEVPMKYLQDRNFFNVYTPGTLEYGNRHYTGKVFFDGANDICARKLIKKYGCRMGGVAVWGPSHCLSALVYATIELFI